MITFPYKIELPCCGSKATLQKKSGTGLDSPDYWKRTCTNIMCQTSWNIRYDGADILVSKIKKQPIFSL